MSSSTTNLIGLGMSPALATLLGNPIVKTLAASTTIDSSYDGAVIYSTAAGAITLTFPNALTTTVRFRCTIIQGGAGAVTVAASGGATIESEGATLVSPGQYAIFDIVSPASGAFILSLGSGGGGGGGGNIETESGTSPIKISAFPAAATPMGSTDVVTGIQGGANANFSQAQILSGRDGVSTAGANLAITAGAGNGAYNGGGVYISGGIGGTFNTQGALIKVEGGNWGGAGGGGGGTLMAYAGQGHGDGYTGGSCFIGAGFGDAAATANGGYTRVYGGGGGGAGGNGGGLQLYGGDALAGNGNGGDIIIRLGAKNGSGANGNLTITNLSSSDPSVSNAVWDNNGVLVKSGITNYSGATTIAGIGAKTLTFVNGILISIA